MIDNILVLPIAGRAERILALPKFLLPINEKETLLASHINAALQAGFDRVLVIAREDHRSLLSEQLRGEEAIDISYIEQETKTMCETLLVGIQNQNIQGRITVALSDSAVIGDPMTEIYSRIIMSEGNSLTLFRPRSDQIGKLGQVEIDTDGKVINMIDKDESSQLPWVWGLSTFKKEFFDEVDAKDAHIGISAQKWVRRGVDFRGLTSTGIYFDCGTFSEYAKYLTNRHTLKENSF